MDEKNGKDTEIVMRTFNLNIPFTKKYFRIALISKEPYAKGMRALVVYLHTKTS